MLFLYAPGLFYGFDRNKKRLRYCPFLKDGLQSFALYLRHFFGAVLPAPKNSKEAGG